MIFNPLILDYTFQTIVSRRINRMKIKQLGAVSLLTFVCVMLANVPLSAGEASKDEASKDNLSEKAAQNNETVEKVVKPKSSPIQANRDGIAIDGFDAVAYFEQSKAVKGVSIHSCEYLDRVWHFSSEENRDKFLEDPSKFVPQYGGYCAHSLSNAKIIESNPKSFSIIDDKLYFYANDNFAIRDAKKSKSEFEFKKQERDNNWFKYQQEF